MVANVSINPMATTNAGGLFSVQSDGMVQGAVMDDPVARFALATGYVGPNETIPFYPGIAITENIPQPASLASGFPDRAYGPLLGTGNIDCQHDPDFRFHMPESDACGHRDAAKQSAIARIVSDMSVLSSWGKSWCAYGVGV